MRWWDINRFEDKEILHRQSMKVAVPGNARSATVQDLE